jgi:hypothetical protein
MILVWSKDVNVLEGDEADKDITKEEYDRFALSDWYIKPQHRLPFDHPDFHPCPWPEELAYRLIRLYSYRRDTVLDPFNGSGTTTYVAKALGRHFIGIDDSPLYCASAKRRLAKLDGMSPAQLEAGVERFVPVEGERNDGRQNHRKATGVTSSTAEADAVAALIALGEKRPVAERLLERAKEVDSTLATAEALVATMAQLRIA